MATIKKEQAAFLLRSLLWPQELCNTMKAAVISNWSEKTFTVKPSSPPPLLWSRNKQYVGKIIWKTQIWRRQRTPGRSACRQCKKQSPKAGTQADSENGSEKTFYSNTSPAAFVSHYEGPGLSKGKPSNNLPEDVFNTRALKGGMSMEVHLLGFIHLFSL